MMRGLAIGLLFATTSQLGAAPRRWAAASADAMAGLFGTEPASLGPLLQA
jgi:hypothetical protein